MQKICPKKMAYMWGNHVMDTKIVDLLVEMDGKSDKMDTETQATRQDIKSLTNNVAEMFEHSTKLITDDVELTKNVITFVEHKVSQLEKELFTLKHMQ